jgi:hypothetical protein
LGGSIDTSQFSFLRPVATDGIVRVLWTGTGGSPGFRTARALGVDATTVLSQTRTGPKTIRLQSTSGTPLNSAAVVSGDKIFFERTTDAFTSPFSSYNSGKTYTVQSKGSGYIDYIDEGTVIEEPSVTLGSGFAQALKVFAPEGAGLRIGDSIVLTSSNFNTANQGTFTVTQHTDTYVEFLNPYAAIETVTNSTNGVFAYDELIGFVYLVSSGNVVLFLDDQTIGSPVVRLDNNVGFFMGSISASKIIIKNETSEKVSIRCQLAALLGC